jgi:tRNA-dihydrouridine synthase
MIHAMLANGVVGGAWSEYLGISNTAYLLAEIDLVPITSTVKHYLKQAYSSEGHKYSTVTEEYWNHHNYFINRYLQTFKTLMEHISYYSHSQDYRSRWHNFPVNYWKKYEHKYSTPNYVYQLINYEELALNAQQDAV